MANAIVTIKMMPTSPEVNLEDLEGKIKEKIVAFAGEGDTKTTVEPVAFGLSSLSIIFIMDESIGATDPLEENIKTLEGINSVEVTDVRRAVG